MNTTTPRRVAVYAASSPRVAGEHTAAARALGAALAKGGAEVVYGGGGEGLMGALADGALAAGGSVTGVIPQFMVDRGWLRPGLTRTVVTPGMHERKSRIIAMASAIVALPGGIGTLEELTEAVTWRQLGLHSLPIIILNTGGYYDPLLAMLRRAIAERFMDEAHARLWSVALTPGEAAAKALAPTHI